MIILFLSCLSDPIVRENCTDSSQCRDLFGFGHICSDSGFCELNDLPKRCDRSFPKDLIENPKEFGTAIPIVELYDSNTYGLRRYGSELAISDFNDLFQPEDRRLVMISCDIKSDQDNAIDGLDKSNATEIITTHMHHDLGVSHFIGPNSSDASIIAFNQLSPQRGIVISPWASAQALETIDTPLGSKSDQNPGLFWRTVASDKTQSHALSLLMKADNSDDIVIIYERGIFADNFALNLSDTLHNSGINSLLIAYDSDQSTIASVLNQQLGIESSLQVAFVSENLDQNIDFINAISSNEQVERLYLAYGAKDDELLTQTDSTLDNKIFFVSPSLSTENTQNHIFDSFDANFKSLSGAIDNSDSILSAFVYDATWLMLFGMAYAMENGDLEDPLLVGLGLRQMSSESGESIPLNAQGWSLAKSQFSVNNAIDIVGASGPLDFNNETEELKAFVDLWKINQEHEFELMFKCFDGICDNLPNDSN